MTMPNTLPLRLYNITSVFVILRKVLLAFSYFENELRSLFTCLLIPFITFLMFNRQVSSANGIPVGVRGVRMQSPANVKCPFLHISVLKSRPFKSILQFYKVSS